MSATLQQENLKNMMDLWCVQREIGQLIEVARQQAPGNQSLQMHNWLYQSQVVVAHTAINLCPIAPGF